MLTRRTRVWLVVLGDAVAPGTTCGGTTLESEVMLDDERWCPWPCGTCCGTAEGPEEEDEGENELPPGEKALLGEKDLQSVCASAQSSSSRLWILSRRGERARWGGAYMAGADTETAESNGAQRGYAQGQLRQHTLSFAPRATAADKGRAPDATQRPRLRRSTRLAPRSRRRNRHGDHRVYE